MQIKRKHLVFRINTIILYYFPYGVTMSEKKPDILIIDKSTTNTDLRYACAFIAPDPFVYLRIQNKTTLIVSPLEYNRALQESMVDEVINSAHIAKKHRATWAHIAIECIPKTIKKITVPPSFPLAYARILERKGIHLRIATQPLFPQRICKDKKEISALREIIHITEQAMHIAEDILRNSIIQGSHLLYKGNILTSEEIRQHIMMFFAQSNAEAPSTIIAGGTQSCDPHCEGYGQLHPGEPIVIDIFPRHLKSGYYGDMTRTFIKGHANTAQKKLYATVRKAHKAAIQAIKPRVHAQTLHKIVEQIFAEAGYTTTMKNTPPHGFIHSTGHGIGLDIHEAPAISRNSTTVLKTGMVFTIEPGLYYHTTGGIRIEDDILVTAHGAEVLSHYPYTFLIT